MGEWKDWRLETPDLDFEVICCRDDDVFMAIYREDGYGDGYFSIGMDDVDVDYWMSKPDVPEVEND